MTKGVPKKEERTAFARRLIIQNPSWGKDHINKAVRAEFGVGLRRIDVARLKDTVLLGRPRARTGRKSVEKLIREEVLPPEISAREKEIRVAHIGFDEAYHRLISVGFLPKEIRTFFSACGSPLVFDSEPFKKMLKERLAWFRKLRKRGLTKEQIIAEIKRFYDRPKASPFDFLKEGYDVRRRKRVDYVEYKGALERRHLTPSEKKARRRAGGLYRRRPAQA